MFTRRSFLRSTSLVLSANAFASTNSPQDGIDARLNGNPASLPVRYPAYPPELIETLVTVSHFSLDKVQSIVDPHPHLVKAAWDWGFGDWETPLGAACHMGRRDIADYLLARGATPSLFSAVLSGDLASVKQIVERQPGIQRVAGPHSISLLAHARMGGKNAEAVLAYLHSLGNADMVRPMPLSDKEQQAICGSYRIGQFSSDVIEISTDMQAYANTPMYTYLPQLNWRHNRTMARPLFHLGDMTFYPAGAPSIQIRFEQAAQSMTMTVRDGGDLLTASRPRVS